MLVVIPYELVLLLSSVFIGNISSIITDGVDDYFTAPDHADWEFGTGSFTVDFWIYRETKGGAMPHASIHTHGASGADVGAWGLYGASAHGLGVSDGNSAHASPAKPAPAIATRIFLLKM